MLRIGKYKYPVEIEEESDLDASDAYFVIKFENMVRPYIGRVKNSDGSVRQKLGELITRVLTKAPKKTDREKFNLYRAFNEGLYITVKVLKMSDRSGKHLASDILSIYKELNIPLGFESGYLCETGLEYLFRLQDTSETEKGPLKKYSGKPVYEYKKFSGNAYGFVKRWKSVKEYIDTGVPGRITPSAVYMCCNEQRKTAYGSVWRFNNECLTIRISDKRKSRGRSARQPESEENENR